MTVDLGDPSRPSIDARLHAAGLPPLDRPAWLEIDTTALAQAVRAIRERVGTGTQVWPVVKDDAYGHGVEVATRSFIAAGAAGVCVATLGEAMAIRAAGIASPVLILYPVADAALPDAMRAGFAISVATSDGAAAVARAWSALDTHDGTALAVHVEVETGFTRMGIPPQRLRAALEVLRRPGIEVIALWSHLSTPEDDRVSGAQETHLADALRLAGTPGIGSHLAATGGLLAGRGMGAALVRPGLIAYGVTPGGRLEDMAAGGWLRDSVRPALRLLARPIRIEEVAAGTTVGYGGTWAASRPSRIATLPVGYGDGYSRAFSGCDVLVRGRRVPVVGIVSMDSCTVDVTDVPEVGLEDEFVLLGHQGGDAIPALALAQRRNTIPWEVLAGMARRLTRVYDAPTGPLGVRTLAGEFMVG